MLLRLAEILTSLLNRPFSIQNTELARPFQAVAPTLFFQIPDATHKSSFIMRMNCFAVVRVFQFYNNLANLVLYVASYCYFAFSVALGATQACNDAIYFKIF